MYKSPYILGIQKHFSNKGVLGPITEKALKNYGLKNSIPKGEKNETYKTRISQRLHYFAIGHSFKQINTKERFEFQFNEIAKEEAPTKYKHLQAPFFENIEKKLETLLENIRNINSHYIHPLENIKTSNLDTNLLSFLTESFQLALIEIFETNNKNDLFLNVKEAFNLDKNYNNFTELVDTLLFIDVPQDIDNHEGIFIAKGRYLSFESCLFLAAMFLYKNEANTLLSKLKGYKKNKGELEENKRKLFCFFSKKFTSQDVNSEENNLVKFRDIIQYLNHYPTSWNNDLKSTKTDENPKMTQTLKEHILDLELERNYPEYKNDNSFKLFAKDFFANEKKVKKKEIMEKLDSKEIEYLKELTTDPHIQIFKKEIEEADQPFTYNPKEQEYKIFIKQHVLNKYFKGLAGYDKFREHRFNYKKQQEFKEKLKTNTNTQKLKKRILENSLVNSYGRNQDRFLNFSIRFLAERNYFGSETKFKCYRFYNMLEQIAFLKRFEGKEHKKTRDAFKYHQGKLVHFTKFSDHLNNYPEWDMPFVNENNAIAIELSLGNVVKTIPIQRKLMVYFLEDALYNTKPNGKTLLTNYFFESHQKDFVALNQKLLNNQTEEIKNNKAAFKKLIPRKLINTLIPPEQNNLPTSNFYEKLLQETEKREKKYTLIKQETKKLEDRINSKTKVAKEKSTLLKDFEKRNKGKRFKLQFVRKACNYMYFKTTYAMQVADSGHHKQYHITRDEFNDFSKWMYAFSGNDHYKHLLNHLFETKGFYLDKEFERLFKESDSLDKLYHKVKIKYTVWLKKPRAKKERKIYYKIDPQKNVYDINTNMFYINVPHFIQYLEQKNILQKNKNEQWKYNSLKNVPYLTTPFYYKDKLTPQERKQHRKLHNKLKNHLLEDALLLEIALQHYDSTNPPPKAKVNQLLNQDFVFPIHNAEQSYTITVPFAKLDSYTAFITQQKNKENQRHKDTFLSYLQEYLQLNKIPKDKNDLYGNLLFEDLNLIQNHVINEGLRFSKIFMTLENYCCKKDDFSGETTYIKTEDMPSLKKYAPLWKHKHKGETINYRNNTYHFQLSLGKTINHVLQTIEKQFIKNELATNLTDFDQLSYLQQKVCLVFLKELHNKTCFTYRENNSVEDKFKNAKNIYFNKIVKKAYYE